MWLSQALPPSSHPDPRLWARPWGKGPQAKCELWRPSATCFPHGVRQKEVKGNSGANAPWVMGREQGQDHRAIHTSCEASRTSGKLTRISPSPQKRLRNGAGGMEGVCFWPVDHITGLLGSSSPPSPPFSMLVGAPGHHPAVLWRQDPGAPQVLPQAGARTAALTWGGVDVRGVVPPPAPGPP